MEELVGSEEDGELAQVDGEMGLLIMTRSRESVCIYPIYLGPCQKNYLRLYKIRISVSERLV